MDIIEQLGSLDALKSAYEDFLNEKANQNEKYPSAFEVFNKFDTSSPATIDTQLEDLDDFIPYTPPFPIKTLHFSQRY